MALSGSSAGVARRLAKPIAERAFTTRLYARSLKGEAPTSLRCEPLDPAPGDPDFANALFQGRYVFGGEQKSALNEPPWNLQDASEAWHVEANSFEWLADFRATEAETARLRARELVRSWIDLNEKWQPLSWRTDVLGRRLVWWACHAGFLCDGAEPTFRRNFFGSFAAQARHLNRSAGFLIDDVWNLPAFVGRVVAEGALYGKTKRFVTDMQSLQELISQEVAPDGTLPSRNAEVALNSLRLLLAAKSVIERLNIELPSTVADTIKRIALGLKCFRHGDGRFGVFNAGNESDRGYIDAILAASKARGATPSALPQGGFHRMSAGRTLLLLDVGKPEQIHPTTHAGLARFELSVSRDRVIVNCGSNGGGQWRKAGRATAAHSTLVVSDTNSIDLSDRGTKTETNLSIHSEHREEAGNALIESWHDGYVTRFGLRHGRAIYLSADGSQIRGEDSLTAVGEKGRNAQPFAIRFHLHPQVNTSIAADGVSALLRLPHGGGLQLRSSTKIALEESIYLGSSEGVRGSQQLVIHGHTEPAGQTILKWAFTVYSR